MSLALKRSSIFSFAFIAALSGCTQNSPAPAVVTAQALCDELSAHSCPQGLDENCAENLDLGSNEFPDCESEQNELRRCYFVDLPADSDKELAEDPFTCVLSDACSDESDRLCRCERGDDCDIEY